MQNRSMRTTLTGLTCVVLLSGCGEFSVKKYIPFTGDAAPERARGPANAAEYQCAAGKRFHVRRLEDGAAVWLTLPEREVRLDKLGTDAAMRYGKGGVVLEINGNDATLTDGTATPFSGCKATGA